MSMRKNRFVFMFRIGGGSGRGRDSRGDDMSSKRRRMADGGAGGGGVSRGSFGIGGGGKLGGPKSTGDDAQRLQQRLDEVLEQRSVDKGEFRKQMQALRDEKEREKSRAEKLGNELASLKSKEVRDRGGNIMLRGL